MLTVVDRISADRITEDTFEVLIEITKGSKKKYELDKETGYIKLDRILYTSTHYPANYGLIPRTLAADGDHLDALVLCSEPLETNILVKCYPIGVMIMTDQNFLDEKIIAIPYGDPEYNKYTDISQLPAHKMNEIAHFFTVYKELEGKTTAFQSTHGVTKAKEIIRQYMQEFFVNIAL